jgi:hypothetical protein
MPTSQNRTKWGISGGAVSFQPGWFSGHQTAFIYINLGIGTVPLNMSFPMVPVFQITGPSNNAYPGTFCLPQVPLPPNIQVNIGDNATIQLIETAVHGAALYSVSHKEHARQRNLVLIMTYSAWISHLPIQRTFQRLILQTASILQLVRMMVAQWASTLSSQRPAKLARHQ